MEFNFDEINERRGTQCVKWDECPDAETLPLWVADMDFKTSPAIVDALRERVEQGIFGYTHPGAEYYEALTGWFSRRHGWNFEAKEVVYTIGVVPAVSAVIKALTQPGDKVIIQTPVYNCFFSSIRNNGCEISENELLRTETSYEMDFAGLEACCADPKAKVLLLCNPHNPAGRVWTHDELRRVDEICKRHNVVVVSDEIHCEIVYEPHKYTPFGTVATAPCVVCCSPSKAFNTAGLQTANIVCSDEKMRAAIDRAININETCDVGPMGVTALIAAYNYGEPWLEAVTEYIRGNYEYLKQTLEALPFGIRVLDLQGTYLAWVDVDALNIPVAWLCEGLKADGKVWLQPGTAYGASGEGYVRVNLATPRAVLAEALKRFEAYIRGL